nr:hypothetical protein SYMBAF_70005 [Serratia symbiotica]
MCRLIRSEVLAQCVDRAEKLGSSKFVYPADICKAIYTTNAIESLNSVIRQVIKKRKVILTDDSVRKVIYLGIQAVSKKWNMPIQN